MFDAEVFRLTLQQTGSVSPTRDQAESVHSSRRLVTLSHTGMGVAWSHRGMGVAWSHRPVESSHRGMTELLSRPTALGDVAILESCADELRAVPNLRVIPLDAGTAIDAARGRSPGRDLGGAGHVAGARQTGATCFLTDDAHIRGPYERRRRLTGVLALR